MLDCRSYHRDFKQRKTHSVLICLFVVRKQKEIKQKREIGPGKCAAPIFLCLNEKKILVFFLFVCYNFRMNKKIKVKKLYTGIDRAEIAKRNKLTLIFSIIAVVIAIAVPCMPMRKGLTILHDKYGFVVYSVCVILWVANAITAVYCLVSHFTLYKIRSEIYEHQKPALKGDWHTFGGIEIQLVLSGVVLLVELFMLVRWFDWQTLLASCVAALGFAAAFVVRKTTYDSFKNLSETPPAEKLADGNGKVVGEDKDTAEKSPENEEVSDFYDKD